MKLEQTDITELMPGFMRDDGSNKGLALGVNPVIRDATSKAGLISIWNNIYRLDERQLNELSWELNIGWYKSTDNIHSKKAMIKNSDKVHAKLGTKWAVEQVITDAFGDGVVREWWEYGGEPYHFKVLSSNPGLVNEHYTEFMEMLEIVKRKSARLDSIIISLTGEMELFAGIATHDMTFEEHTMGDHEAIVTEAAALAANI